MRLYFNVGIYLVQCDQRLLFFNHRLNISDLIEDQLLTVVDDVSQIANLVPSYGRHGLYCCFFPEKSPGAHEP